MSTLRYTWLPLMNKCRNCGCMLEKLSSVELKACVAHWATLLHEPRPAIICPKSHSDKAHATYIEDGKWNCTCDDREFGNMRDLETQFLWCDMTCESIDAAPSCVVTACAYMIVLYMLVECLYACIYIYCRQTVITYHIIPTIGI